MEGAVLMSALSVNEIVIITSLLTQIIKPIIINHYVTKTLSIFLEYRYQLSVISIKIHLNLRLIYR